MNLSWQWLAFNHHTHCQHCGAGNGLCFYKVLSHVQCFMSLYLSTLYNLLLYGKYTALFCDLYSTKTILLLSTLELSWTHCRKALQLEKPTPGIPTVQIATYGTSHNFNVSQSLLLLSLTTVSLLSGLLERWNKLKQVSAAPGVEQESIQAILLWIVYIWEQVSKDRLHSYHSY